MPDLTPKSLADEAWREYEWKGTERGEPRTYCYRITDPAQLIIGTTTHRVIGADGIVHCVPAVGLLGCVLRWQPRPGAAPVAF